MGSLVLQIGLVAVLVALNGIFAGSEMALVSIRESQLAQLQHRGRRGRSLAALVRRPNEFLAAAQIGVTLAGFLASATAAVTLAHHLAERLSFLGNAAAPVSVIVITGLLTLLTLVFGELAPKRLAMQRAVPWGLVVARPLTAVVTIFAPVIRLLGWASDGVVRALGGDPSKRSEEVTAAELRDLLLAQDRFSKAQRKIIVGALEIGELRLTQVLVPRTRVFVLQGDTATAEGLRLLIESRHERAPVTQAEELDDLLGIVHLRDLVGGEGTVADHVRPAMLLPETMKVVDALGKLQREREQMAVVLNQHLEADGIVTMEDLIEEVVGEICDETDLDVAAVHRLADGSLIVPGSFSIHDLPDIGVELPRGPYTTVAGLVLHSLVDVPDHSGDEVIVGDWTIRVTETVGHTISTVRLTPRGAAFPAAEPAGSRVEAPETKPAGNGERQKL